MTALFLAWQDSVRRLWFPVGRLSREGQLYRFEYLHGALEARRQAGFAPLISFPDLEVIYLSETLFPMFHNRVMGPSRAEYHDYLTWLDIPAAAAEPLLLLARGGGHRATDAFEVFPAPEVSPEGLYRALFFVHGLRYMPEASRKRAEQLEVGERLLLMRGVQNGTEPDALMLRTAEVRGRDDRYLLGYCPRYLLTDLKELLGGPRIDVRVQRVNPPPAPSQVRVLCRLEARCLAGFTPLAGEIFQPIVPMSVAA